MRPEGTDRYREVVTPSTWQRLKDWFGGLNPWVVDGGVAVVFVILGLVTTSGRGNVANDLYEPRDALSVVLVIASAVPFVFLRRAPLAVLLVSTCAVVLNSLLGHNEGATPFFLWVAVVMVAATCTTPEGDRRRDRDLRRAPRPRGAPTAAVSTPAGSR